MDDISQILAHNRSFSGLANLAVPCKSVSHFITEFYGVCRTREQPSGWEYVAHTLCFEKVHPFCFHYN